MAGRPDFYAVLGVQPEAPAEVVTGSYRALCRLYHPDVNPDPKATERMKLINEAYDTLGDPAKRAAYDRQRRATGRSRPAAHWSAPSPPPPPPPPSPPSPRPAAQHRVVCGHHPAEPAAAVCGECGMPMCRACASEPPQAVCAGCFSAWRWRRRAWLSARPAAWLGSWALLVPLEQVAAPWRPQGFGGLLGSGLLAVLVLAGTVGTRAMWRALGAAGLRLDTAGLLGDDQGVRVALQACRAGVLLPLFPISTGIGLTRAVVRGISTVRELRQLERLRIRTDTEVRE